MTYFFLFISFLFVGFFGFGGPDAVLSMVEHVVVVECGWMTHTQFADLVIVSRMVPGETAVNAATLSGYMAVFNNLGFFTALGASFAALLGLATPSFVWAEIAERITLPKEYRPIVESVFDFLRVIVPGLIGGVAMSLCRPEIVGDLTSPWQLGVSAILCLFTIIGMSVFRFNPIFLILLCGVAGMLLL
jgi:chromate transporter